MNTQKIEIAQRKKWCISEYHQEEAEGEVEERDRLCSFKYYSYLRVEYMFKGLIHPLVWN